MVSCMLCSTMVLLPLSGAMQQAACLRRALRCHLLRLRVAVPKQLLAPLLCQVLLVVFAGMMAGLTLGLLSLDK